MTTSARLRGVDTQPVVDTFDIAVVQTGSRTGAWQQNIDAVAAEVRTLAAAGSKLIVLPELFASGYDLDDLDSMAESVPGRTSIALGELAADTDTVLVTAIVFRDSAGVVFDSSLVVGPDGLLAVGHKRFLWDREKSVFTPGAESGLLVSTPFGTIGVVICYEAGFPETVRDLVQRGADVIAVPSAFGHVRLHVWKLLTRSRALENGVVVAAAGLTGQAGDGPRFAGHSVIVGPQGRTIVEMDEGVGSVSATVTRREMLDARDEVPYLKDLALLGGITETRTTENDHERNRDVRSAIS
ncbi:MULTISPECIES: carbon-nitrogen hydrolase family protein [Rhodococcus]|uniref:Carbon-nitrogen hydrolase family protein n=2 Tax=Rhodococcus TaxID=1827 RepID=A0ABU4B359_9NOCA|nr:MULTISPECIES: carbon-nitrogen hydrolase family protein [Rhodococcus]MDV6232910.1 carbon-nitrogen hydrolase family protein [Rhodococcus cercidiphylli]MDV6304580.1 carbon-nitrogen hydrolase family protein [Rhodococcus cerastii]MDV8058011.1 carbon-nitrogen hydrolase family protein [Rhodococcus sp. IEGM 1343]